MDDRISPEIKEYLKLQNTLKGKEPDPEEWLLLYNKAKQAGLVQEARHHLRLAGQRFPQDNRIRERLSAELDPEEFQVWQRAHSSEAPFWKDPGDLLRYPGRGQAWIITATAALGLSLGRMLEDAMRLWPALRIFSVPAFVLGGLAWFIIALMLPALLCRIVSATARGVQEFPLWPGWEDPWGQIVLPALRSLLVLMWSFLPLALVLTAAVKSHARPSLLLLLLSLGYGCLYFPMAFLMASFSGKLWPSLLPSNLVEAITKTFGTYLRLVLFFWLFIIPFLLLTALLWPTPFLGAILPSLAGVYGWAAAARLLGRFYQLEAGRLEWM